MRSLPLVSTPSTKTVAMEQLRVVGLALRRETLLLCAGLVLLVLILPFFETDLTSDGRPFVLDPADLGPLAILVGLVAPLGVWKGERFYGESALWTAPVDHARHARLKIAAGWLWLMAVVAFGLLMIVSAVVRAGGTAGVDETRLFVVNPELAQGGPAGPLTEVRWSSQPWQWVLPFTGATAVYLAASAFLIGFRRPVVWGVGFWLFGFAIVSMAEERVVWAMTTLEGVGHALNMLITGGSNSASVLLESGQRVRGWTRFPDARSWASATAMWLAVAGIAAWAASGRHREGGVQS